MSVYIKGEEFYKPTACAPCKIRQWCQLWKQVTLPAHIVHPECPIIEVHDHGRLIDADELLKKAHYRMGIMPGGVDEVEAFIRAIDLLGAPTIIPADKEGDT